MYIACAWRTAKQPGCKQRCMASIHVNITHSYHLPPVSASGCRVTKTHLSGWTSQWQENPDPRTVFVTWAVWIWSVYIRCPPCHAVFCPKQIQVSGRVLRITTLTNLITVLTTCWFLMLCIYDTNPDLDAILCTVGLPSVSRDRYSLVNISFLLLSDTLDSEACRWSIRFAFQPKPVHARNTP